MHMYELLDSLVLNQKTASSPIRSTTNNNNNMIHGAVVASLRATPRRFSSRARCAVSVCAGATTNRRLCSARTYFTLTKSARAPRDASEAIYSMERAFEEPTFRFLYEGDDMDYKQEVREALVKLLGRPPHNFTKRTADDAQGTAVHTLQLFRAVCRLNLVSFAQVRSTPGRLMSFFEVLATAHPALALLAADHFTFAGLIATHAGAEVQRCVLDAVDSGKLIGCIAQRELIADGPPLNTEARYDLHEGCFFLRGTGKFAVVAGDVADWAVLTATLTLHKNGNHGPHAFAVPLREAGVLLPGITVSRVDGENPVMSAAGLAVVHFNNVRLPAHHLLQPFTIRNAKLESVEGQEGAPSALEVLKTRSRLATAALSVGTLKTFLTDVTHFVAAKTVVGPDHRRNYPYLGLQHVQTPLVKLVANTLVYLAAWQRLLPVFTNVAGRKPRTEDEMLLAGVLHFLRETIVQLRNFSDELMGVHGSFASTGGAAAVTVAHIRQEQPDASLLIREVALRSVTQNIGTTHWGWWLTNLLQPIFPVFNRFLRNPMYSPRIADLSRHFIFFSHKHYTLKRRLRNSRELERRKGGSEHQWFDWTMFRHRDVVLCGEAFMEIHFLEVVMAEMQRCADLRGRKTLRDVGWVFALGRQLDRLDFVLENKMLSAHKAVILKSHLDNVATVFAPQCVNLTEAMQVPIAFRSPCASRLFELYWTIPGTNTHAERGDRVMVAPSARTGNTKAEQEAVREEDSQFDLFHGLADEPSHASRKP